MVSIAPGKAKHSYLQGNCGDDLRPAIAMTEDEVLASCNMERSAHQPELEAFVRERMPELDLRDGTVVRKHIEYAERFGACVID